MSLFFPIIGAHLLLLFITQFTLWPEMVVYPYLMNNGFELYRDIINPYQPLFLYFLMGFSKVVGYRPLPYQLLTYFMIILIDLIIFKTSIVLFKNKMTSYLSVIFFVIFSIPFGVNGLWFDLVQTPFIIGSVYYLYLFVKQPNRKNIFYLSILLTITFFIKQQAIWLIVLTAGLIIYRYKTKTLEIVKNNVLTLVPFIIILFLFIVLFAFKETLSDYIFWSLRFPLFASSLPGYLLLPKPKELLFVSTLFLIAVTSIFLLKKEKIIAGSALSLFLFAYPRFDYFHLVPALAVISLVFGQTLKSLKSSLKIILFSFLTFLLSILFINRFQNSFLEETRFFEKDIMISSQQISKEVYSEKLVFLQNAPDQLLPLASLIPTKPWADDFPWYMEVNNIQTQVLAGLEKQNPKVIISSPYIKGETYGLGVYRPVKIVEFIEKNFKKEKEINKNFLIYRKIE